MLLSFKKHEKNIMLTVSYKNSCEFRLLKYQIKTDVGKFLRNFRKYALTKQLFLYNVVRSLFFFQLPFFQPTK